MSDDEKERRDGGQPTGGVGSGIPMLVPKHRKLNPPKKKGARPHEKSLLETIFEAIFR